MLSILKRLPPRLGIVLMAALGLYTTHKLYLMCRIRGFIGVRHVEVHHVTGKTAEHGMGPGGRERTFCFVSWAADAAADDQSHRVPVECDYWETVKEDDRIEVIRLSDDGAIYLRGADVYTSDGNFIFDLVLFGLELFGILFYWNRLKAHAETTAEQSLRVKLGEHSKARSNQSETPRRSGPPRR
jgi:hypothetical protein